MRVRIVQKALGRYFVQYIARLFIIGPEHWYDFTDISERPIEFKTEKEAKDFLSQYITEPKVIAEFEV